MVLLSEAALSLTCGKYETHNHYHGYKAYSIKFLFTVKTVHFCKGNNADDLGAGQLLVRNLNMSQPMVFLHVVV